ncbi:NYN domain-containing protein [Celeribacter halophilus]|uniref:NYN domain-containing protein n=1 Tax=Celeribacter halophilus TaxID=576117 RepID=UPI003A9226E4
MAQSVAVLVDGDNISGKYAKDILTAAGKHGEPSVVRVYRDAQSLSDWHNAYGYRMIHAGTGKNAADILLALDAMELLLVREMRCFVIASSDGDFTHIATRLRENGAKVIGLGEEKAPDAFRACCSRFVELGARKPVAPPRLVPKEKLPVRAFDLNVRSIIAERSKNRTGARLSEVSQQMYIKHDVKISSFPEKNWRSYFKARPELYDLDPPGAEAKVRFRPEGFSRATTAALRKSA